MSTPYVQIAALVIDPARLADYRAALQRHADAALTQEPGVLTLCAVASPDDPSQMRVFEVYADEAAYQAHLNAPHFLAYKEEVEPMVRSLSLTRLDPVCLGSKAIP